MELFYGVLLMLGAILLSNLINRFLPSFSIPIIQIALGIVYSLLPSVYHFKFDPELFLILFLAPLLFHDGMHSDKKSLWSLKKPIILLALGLVFFTVVVAGFLINFMIPSIPLAAAFALAAALAPTDAVAVSSLGKRIHIPGVFENLLEGEALINDASGIVSFQFAVAAMLTGTFSLIHAGMKFFYVALGGVLIGILMTTLKYLLVKWIRSLGMENVTFHLLIGILTPFLIYMTAEECQVSGILAVVVSGVIHSFEGRRLNPETASLNIASQSLWSMLAFILNGLVFLILGMQLPEIINTIWFDQAVSNFKTLGYIFAITAAMMLIRFVWSYFTVGEEILEVNPSETADYNKAKASLIISMSGVRGSVTLATILSLPLVISNEKDFPQRDLLIFIAAGVILCSLLIANFVLPLFFHKESAEEASQEEKEACLEIIENVVRQLEKLMTPENRSEIGVVIRGYILRAEELKIKNNLKYNPQDEERLLRSRVLSWEEEYTKAALTAKEINEETALQYLDTLEKIQRKNEVSAHPFRFNFNKIIKNWKYLKKWKDLKEPRWENRLLLLKLKKLNNKKVLERLYVLKGEKDSLTVNKLIEEYERMEILLKSRAPRLSSGQVGEYRAENSSVNERENYADKPESITELMSLGFQMERDGIQAMFELNRISRDTAQTMRKNIALMELQLRKENL